MYKFFGEPLKIIKSKATNKPVFRFDTKGEFITDDPEIIKRALGYFDYIEMTAEVKGDKHKKTVTQKPLTITHKEEKKHSYKELQAMAKERGIKSFGINQAELEKLLEV